MATPVIGRFSELDFVVNQPLPDNLFVNITNNPAQAYLDGKLEGFYSSFENGKFYIRGTPIATQEDGRLTIIAVDREDETNIVTQEVVFNVRNPAPVVERLDPVRIVRGVEQDIFLPIANNPANVEVFGLLTGLKYGSVEGGARVTGVVPVGAEFSKEADTFRIAAENDGGDATGTLDFTLATATLPAQVTGLTGRSVAGAANADLTWTAPTDGGTPIIRYEVSVDNGEWVSTGSTAAAYRATGLRAGTRSFRVRAVNGLGAGAASVAVNVRIVLGRAPSGTITLAAVAGDGQVALSWNHPSDRGDPTATYQVYRGSTLIASVSGTSYTDTGRTNGTAYSYRVWAVNAVGSRASNTVSATPQASVAPIIEQLPRQQLYWREYVSIQHRLKQGTPPITWSIATGGSHPSPLSDYELSFSSATGRISGIIRRPSLEGRQASELYRITATNAQGSDTKEFRFNVRPGANLRIENIPDIITAVANGSISVQPRLVANQRGSGTSIPLTGVSWRGVGVPSGLSVSSSTGLISGSISRDGTYSMILVGETTDARIEQRNRGERISIRIAPASAVAPGALRGVGWTASSVVYSSRPLVSYMIIDATFRTPASDGGSPVIYYEIKRTDNTSWIQHRASGLRSVGDRLYIPWGTWFSGQTFSFDVRARNAVGAGPSTTFSATIPSQVP